MKSTGNTGYRERIAAATIALLLSSGAALYVLFADARGDEPIVSRLAMASPPERQVDDVAAPGQYQRPEAELSDLKAGSAAEPSPTPRVPSPATSTTLENARVLAAEARWPEAIALYDRLHAATPSDRELSIERARVLAWSGAPGAGAAAIAEALATGDEDVDLRLEQAQFHWWDGDFAMADAAVGSVLAARPRDAAADSLRTRIRAGSDPDVALAATWVDSRPGALEHLLLARALARADRSGEAVRHYREVLRLGAPSDSVALEASAIAAGVDSVAAAIEALDHFVVAHPDDGSVRLRRARLYVWASRLPEARTEYRRLMGESPISDIRFELAQLEFAAGNAAAAEAELQGLIALDPNHAAARTLLGNVMGQRGEWQASLSYSGDPLAEDGGGANSNSDASANLVDPRSQTGSSANAQNPSTLTAWRVSTDVFGDSEDFRWLSTRANHLWSRPSYDLDLSVQHNTWDGASPVGATQPGTGFGAEIAATTRAAQSLSVTGRVGAQTLGGGFNRPTWGAALRYEPGARRTLTLVYDRQAAVRRATTIAAVRAEAVSDLVQLTAARPVLGIDVWSRAEFEHFSSDEGGSSRLAGTLSASRALGAGVTASAVVGHLVTDDASPTMPGWGPLYWSPLSYTSAAAGLAYTNGAPNRWSGTFKVSPGFVWAEERSEDGARFPDSRFPMLGLSGEGGFAVGSWWVLVGGDWSGALQAGYRAAALRLQVSQPLIPR